jgi:hypothetical protein
MSEPCNHEPYEEILAAADGVRWAMPVVILYDFRWAQALAALRTPGIYREPYEPGSTVRLMVLGCRHCKALYVTPELGPRKLEAEDPYRPKGT